MFDFHIPPAKYNDVCFLLTDVEKTVLDLKRRGIKNVEIAAEIYCSERTVNRIIKRIAEKLQ
nr:MAG TPA: hypothetical protein [Caudoviricetes sp.]